MRAAEREREAALAVARIVRAAGGRALLVGGCVRDELLGGTPKDLDLECFGISAQDLQTALAEKFELDLVGASFGVLKLKHLDIDVALPRRETKLGLGHKAFGMEHDPNLSVAEASARRDFTVNAIYRDPLTDEILDPWNGRADLEKRVLRHVSDHFREDPLRVLRGMQFVARFDLDPAPETIAVCRGMTPEGLPPERLFEEWAKLLTKGVKISKGLEFLRSTGWVRYYPELERLIGCEQDPEWHPEGDVWNHTLCCLDAFARERDRHNLQPSAFNLQPADDLIVGLAVLCHDFGKPATTAFDPVKKRIRSLGHDEAGVGPTRAFLRRLTNEERILKEVPPLVQLHMRPFAMWKDKSSDNAIRRLAAKVVRIDRLVRVAAADDAGIGSDRVSVGSIDPNDSCSAPNDSCPTPNASCSALNASCPALNDSCPTPNASCSALNASCSAPNDSCPALNDSCPAPNDSCPALNDSCLTLNDPFPPHCRWLLEQAERLRIADSAPKPIVQGRDLIALGMKPGVRFGKILKAAYEAQLDGSFFDLESGIEFVKEHCHADNQT